MSTVTVGYLFGIVRKTILDAAENDFSDSELIDLFNICTRKIVSLRPDAYIVSVTKQLVSGYEQTIPTAQPIWVDMVKPLNNMGTDGLTIGTPVTEVDLDVMDRYQPGWRTETASTTVQHTMRIPGIKGSFYVYPQSDGTNYISIEGAAVPTDIVYDAGGDWEDLVISLDDTYVDAYRTGMLWLANTEESDIPGKLPQNDLYHKRFLTALGATQ